MAKEEKLNEEAAHNNNTPPIASKDDLVFLNELNNHDKYLPKTKSKDKTHKEKIYLE